MQSSAILPWAVEQIESECHRAEQESHRAEQEFQRAEQESHRADREHEQEGKLIAYLRAQGLDPTEIV